MTTKPFTARRLAVSGNSDISNVNITAGNLAITTGNITVNTGSVTVNAGSIMVGNSTSNVVLYSNGTIFSNGSAFSPGGSIGGADTQVLFNDGGSSAGNAAFTYTKATYTVAVGNSTSNVKISQTNITIANSTGNVAIVPTAITINGPTAVTAVDYLVLKPSDVGAGKPGLYVTKAATANVWNVTLWDGGSTNGTINFNAGTLTQLTNQIWTAGNDGSGSGLDADTLDGYDSAAFARLAGTPTFSTRTTIAIADTAAIANVSASKGILEVQQTSTGAAMMAFYRSGSHGQYFGLDTDNVWKVGGWTAGAVANKIWHEGNDGSGSGLDADTLDGFNSTAFARLAAAPTFTAGPITLATGTTGQVALLAGTSGTTGYVSFSNTSGFRKGYIGFASESGTLNLIANENSATGLYINGNTSITGFISTTTTGSIGTSLTVGTTIAGGNTTVTGFVNASSTITSGSTITGTAFNTSSDSKQKKKKRKIASTDHIDVDYYAYEMHTKKGEFVGNHFGAIAQQVQKKNPDLVTKDEDGFLSLNYTSLFSLELAKLNDLVKAQDKYIQKLEKRLAKLEAK